MFEVRGIQARVALFVSLILVCAFPVFADGDTKLEVHGFLTQAYGTASFATGPAADLSGGQNFDEKLIGIPEDGTFDYRNLALQFRYEISENDTMIIQLSNEATGVSPVDDLRDEVELDWAFYERKIGVDTRLRVGRIQIPWGIYNEIRDVGTVLPFYRPAYSIYLEGGFTSETVDGLGFVHTFAADSDWSVDLDVYVGEYEAFEVAQNGNLSGRVKARDVFGAQFWLNTPVSGLRFGAAFQTKSLEEGLEGILRPVGGANDYNDFIYSIDGDFDRWSLRAEYRTFEPDNIPSFIGTPNQATLDLSSYYVQVGFGINDKLRVYAQFESQDFEQISADLAGGSIDYNQREDLGIALNYYFSSQLVLKAEYHDYSYEAAAIFPIFRPGLPPLLGANILGADGGDYGILALSVSF